MHSEKHEGCFIIGSENHPPQSTKQNNTIYNSITSKQSIKMSSKLVALAAAAQILEPYPVGSYVGLSDSNPTIEREPCWTNSDIWGVLLRAVWSDVEATTGVYDWSYFDKSLQLCKQYGKKAQLCLIGGWRSPNWIYSLGAEPFAFASGKTGSVGPVRFLFWAILMLVALLCGQTVQGQDLSSKDVGRSVAVEPAKAEQTIPENELYAEAKRFLQAKDYASAFRLMEKAAAAGHLLAMNDLGDMYYSGDGVPQEYEQAFAWYRKGAMAGNVLAMANLAYLYEHGWGIGKDTVQACAWYRKAAAAGDQDSIRNLRRLDPNGEVVTQDETLTREWYQSRAFAGDADAMYKLGAMYAYGRGVPQDYAKAVEWYSKAARSGLADAMNDLGCLYAKGQGVPADVSIAREWYKKAAEAGSPEGLQNLKRLNSIDALIQSADRLARIFFWVFLLPGAMILFIAIGRYSSRLRSQFSGPSRVKLALLLLWTNLALALARLSLASFLDQSLGVGFGCFIGAVGLAFHSVLLRFVGKGSNKARAILLVGILLAIPLSPFLVQTAIKSFPSATFTIVGLALHAFGVFLLFSGESSNWFSSRRRARTMFDGEGDARSVGPSL
jgi:TPR repeat protein